MFERRTGMEDSIPDRPEDSVPGQVEDKIPEGFERKLPPGIGELTYEPRRQLTLDSLPPWARKWLGLLLIPVPIAIAIGLYWLGQPHPVSQRQAEQDVASAVGQATGTTVTAKCSVPDKNGYSCTLRDSKGRYGYSATITGLDRQHSDRYVKRTYNDTAYGFPVNADGTGSQTIQADSVTAGDLQGSIDLVLNQIGGSLDNDVFALLNDIDCGDASELTAAVTPCQVRAPILSATIKNVGNGQYLLTYKVRVPGA